MSSQIDYVYSLSPKLIEIAKEDCNENEIRLEQSLAQFRELLDKHPFIKCRTDSIFLLQFLRAKKYNVMAALEMLENLLINRYRNPRLFHGLDIEDLQLRDLLETGYFLPLIEKDDRGRQVIIWYHSKFDVHKFKAIDAFRLIHLVLGYFMLQEDCQVAGFIFISVGSNISMKYLSSFSEFDLRAQFKVMKMGQSKIKEIHLVSFPSFASTIIEMILNTLGDKVKKRVLIYKDVELMKNYVDPKFLPLEYGGISVSINDVIVDIKGKLQRNREDILKIDDFNVDLKNMSPSWSTADDDDGVCGSFRKLTVD